MKQSGRPTTAPRGAAARVRPGRIQGFGLAELLVAMAVGLAAAAGAAALIAAAGEAVRVQPESADQAQRLRVGVDAVVVRLHAAGLGSQAGAGAGSLARRVPVLFPHRRAVPDADPDSSAHDDRITVFAMPRDGTLVAIGEAMPDTASPVRVISGPGCPVVRPACRFGAGEPVLVFDATGSFEVFVPRAVGDDTLEPPAPLSKRYDPALGAGVVPIDVGVLSFDSQSRHLRVAGAGGRDMPIVDEVVGFRVRYFGTPAPPMVPTPPSGLSNCVVDEDGEPRLPALTPTWGLLVELAPRMLSDGPWCGDPPHRFDADLYRLRRLRITLRVQAARAALRGVDPLLFTHPGSATSARFSLPDQEVTVDIAPPNLQRLPG
jgi:hypothetical protein